MAATSEYSANPADVRAFLRAFCAHGPRRCKAAGHRNIGYIEIPGVLSEPVVYRDNRFYLTHDFYGRESASGTVFLDEGSPMKSGVQNLLVHGHNMRDGTAFGRLVHYTDRRYWRSHCVIRFSTLYSTASYVIFAVLPVTTEDVTAENYLNYAGHPTFESEAEFDAYIAKVRSLTLHPWLIDLNAQDRLLTLSTCLEDGRLVLLARRVRSGESTQQAARWIRG